MDYTFFYKNRGTGTGGYGVRSKYFWLAILALALLVAIISCVSSDTPRYISADHPIAPIIPDVIEDEYTDDNDEEYYYPEHIEPEPTPTPPPDPGVLDLQTETVLVAGRYAGTLTWGYFSHSSIAYPLSIIESQVVDMYTGQELLLSDIIDYEQIEKALDLLAAAILAGTPDAAPYLNGIGPYWLSHMVMDHEGLRVLLSPETALWGNGFVDITIPYSSLDDAFLLGIELGLWEAPRRPLVALTFDDGPSEYTEMILDILEAYGARATFCVLGNRIHHRPQTLVRTLELGSEVVGHSWNHANFANLNNSNIQSQISRASDAIEEATGQAPPRIFRAPYGITNNRVINVATEMGYSILNWSVDPKDWYNRDAQAIYENIMSRVADGSIVLLHDIRIYTVDAVAMVVPRLLEEGFLLVTASELIEDIYGELTPGRTYFGRHISSRVFDE